MSGFALKPTTKGTDFALCDLRLVVIQFEGTVQVLFLADGWDGGPRKVLSNCFADAETPGQLRALADHLERLPLPAPFAAPDAARVAHG